ncbi:hypothetical protein PG991_006933 [Apiospora marii]|uniref:Anaphase-promoting complex subunit 1 n=1 Tax=Apiospora marii TaxID=335849 RepID=A0ABR1RYQ3_9PEZI
MNPLRELGDLGDAITELENSGIQVLLAGKGIRALCNSIRTPSANISSENPIVLSVMLTGLEPSRDEAVRRFFYQLHCSVAISPASPPMSPHVGYMVHCVDGPPADSSIQLTDEHLLFHVGDRFRILLPLYFDPLLTEYSASIENAAVPALLDYSGPNGTPGNRVDLELARASSMWHSATVPSDVNNHEDEAPGLSTMSYPNMLVMSVNSIRLSSRVSSGNRGDFFFALGDYLERL